MSNHVAFFAIHADDVQRARSFYERVFGWRFEAWGPPDFYLIRTDDDPSHIRGALHPRQEPLEGSGIRGFECSISVDSVDDAADRIRENGGRITHEKTSIPGIGWVANFEDPEGNRAAVVRYRDEPK